MGDLSKDAIKKVLNVTAGFRSDQNKYPNSQS